MTISATAMYTHHNQHWLSILLLSLLTMMADGSVEEDPGSTTIAINIESTTPETRIDILSLLKLELANELEDQTERVGNRLSMDCEITGFPAPIYTWYKDGVLIDANTNRRFQIRDTDWGNRLRLSSVEMTDAGLYTCRAENAKGVLNTTATLRVIPSQGVDSSAAGNTNKNNDNSPSSSGGIPTGDGTDYRPSCQEYRGNYCAFMKTKLIYVTSRLDQTKAETTIYDLVGQLTSFNVLVDTECFRKSVEATCYFQMPVCQEQSLNVPTPVKLCRRECEALFPVCQPYFRDDSTKWKLLPECSQLNNDPGCISIGLTADPSSTAPPAIPDSTDGEHREPSGDSEGISKLYTEIGLPAALGAVLVVGVIIAVVCIVKRRKTGTLGSGTRSSSDGSHAKSAELSSLSDKAGMGFVKEVTLDNINMLQELGKASFGTVYHGQAFGLYGSNTASAVYIKCLDEGYSSEQLKEFNEERAQMSDIRHQNILSLLAVSSSGIKQCLLYEYLQMGDLRLSILNQQSHGVIHSTREVMYMVTQVASSLEYLSIINFVHKDIAAHNVMVSHNLNVKLSTLKIIHGVHSANYYALHNRLLPVRWLPPETITYNKFNAETDIYSFGVFLWECFSVAQLPYNGFSSQEVIEMIRSRQLLPCPPNCPPRIYSLMMECWHENPSKRPTAKEVHQKLRSWYLENTDLTGGPSATSASSTAPSQHSSTSQPPSYPGHHIGNTEATSTSKMMRPGYMQPGASTVNSSIPYYSSIVDPYNKSARTASTTSNSLSHDEMSEATESVVSPSVDSSCPPKDPTTPSNYYTNSTPNQRFASLSRRKADADFIPQTTPLFHETDQV